MKTELLGNLQQEIMEVLWRSPQPLKPNEVLKQLKGDHAYTTIMTVLKRMADKKILKRQLVGKAYFYNPHLSKDQFIESNLYSVFGNLVNSYGKLAISQFVGAVKTNKKDLELLKQYLQDETSKP